MNSEPVPLNRHQSAVAWGDELEGVAEEQEIEKKLVDHGWTIVHPEDLPLQEQIDLLAGASRLGHPTPGGRASPWQRASGAHDVRWSGVDVDEVVRTIVRSSRS